MWLVSLGVLVFQRDLGSSLLFFGLFLVMLYVATERPGWLVVGSTLFVGRRLRRLPAVQPRAGPRRRLARTRSSPDNSYQIVQGMYGMAWGGLVGRGLGQGDPTLIPFSYSDFIFAAIGEELGLTGVDGDHRALRPDRRARPAHRAGVPRRLRQAGRHRSRRWSSRSRSSWSIGGVTKLIPLTGLTTPFLSYGGSSLVANWAIIALLLRISDQARRPLPDLSDDRDRRPTTTPPRW